MNRRDQGQAVGCGTSVCWGGGWWLGTQLAFRGAQPDSIPAGQAVSISSPAPLTAQPLTHCSQGTALNSAPSCRSPGGSAHWPALLLSLQAVSSPAAAKSSPCDHSEHSRVPGGGSLVPSTPRPLHSSSETSAIASLWCPLRHGLEPQRCSCPAPKHVSMLVSSLPPPPPLLVPGRSH